MKAYSIYNDILALLQDNLDIKVTETYPSYDLSLPLENPLLTVELKSGSRKKVVIETTLYIKESSSSNECRNITEQIGELILKHSIDNFKTFTSGPVKYNEEMKAFYQKSEILCEVKDSEVEVVNVLFGDEVLASGEGAKLNVERRTSVYYSPISGNLIEDLGVGLKTITGVAQIDNTQFNNLYSFIINGTTKLAQIGNVTFNAKLTKLQGRGGGSVEYKIMEVV